MTRKKILLALWILFSMAAVLCAPTGHSGEAHCKEAGNICIDSAKKLSTTRLPQRSYGIELDTALVTSLDWYRSDRDYYSGTPWNHALAARINSAGGSGEVFIYPDSKYDWSSLPEIHEGAAQAVACDTAPFCANSFSHSNA